MQATCNVHHQLAPPDPEYEVHAHRVRSSNPAPHVPSRLPHASRDMHSILVGHHFVH